MTPARAPRRPRSTPLVPSAPTEAGGQPLPAAAAPAPTTAAPVPAAATGAQANAPRTNLRQVARQTVRAITPRAFVCQCGRPIFFRNSTCLACGTPLGYAPEPMALMPLEPAETDGHWSTFGSGAGAPEYLRCKNLQSAAACNWLVNAEPGVAAEPTLCRCCRLTRTLPDLSVPGNADSWLRIEIAKRRLVSSLIGFGLPVQAKVGEDPAHGLAFDLLRAPPGGPKVTTGHDDGVITLDVEEADDAIREQRRNHLGEVYRTLLGHLRHEIGHYYWQTLVEPGPWLAPFRELFGDERQDYATALKNHYANGPRPDWPSQFVSAYASSHPWEDWAETWAHYLHMVDTMDTALSFGLDSEQVDLSYDRFTAERLGVSDDHAEDFLTFVNGWMELTGVFNELSRSMGLADFYPFVLPLTAVRKLYFVHRVVRGAAEARAANPPADTTTQAPSAAPPERQAA